MTLALAQPQSTLNALADYLAGQKSPNTRRAYLSDIRQFAEFYGSQDLRTVTRGDMFRFRAWLIESGDYQPSAINRKLSAVRGCFKEAVLRGYIGSSPAEGITGHKLDAQFSSTVAPSHAQVEELLAMLSSDDLLTVRDRAIIYVLAAMGLRREEVVSLRADSLFQDQGIWVLEILGKGSKTRRCAVPAKALAAVRHWLDAAQLPAEEPMFQALGSSGPSHKPLHVNSVYLIVKARLAAVGITDCSTHSLRHFFATFMLAKGTSIYTVQRLMGHADPRTTERYDRARMDTNLAAMEVIDF